MNTIAYGDRYDLSASGNAGGTGAINTHYSAFRSGAHENVGTGGTIAATDHPVHANPVFASPTDFHELASSPTIDAGTATGLTGTLDLAGLPRTLGPAPDIGAYEFGGSPVATTDTPATVNASTVTLPGTIDAQDGTTSYYFSYGPTTGYGTDTAATSATSVLGAQNVSATVTGLAPGIYHYRLTASNSFGTSLGSDQTFTVAAPSAPTLTSLKLSPTRFRAAASGSSAVAARAPIGALLTYVDSQAATTNFTVTGTVRGERNASHCGPSPKHIKRGQKRCTFTQTFGRFSFSAGAGPVRVRFSGRVNGHKLTPRTYTLTAVTRTAAGLTSTPQSASFTILR